MVIIWKYITLTVGSRLCGEWWWRLHGSADVILHREFFNLDDVLKGRQLMMVWRCYGLVMHYAQHDNLEWIRRRRCASIEGKRSHLQIDGWVDDDTLKGGSNWWELHGGVSHNEQSDIRRHGVSTELLWRWELLIICGVWWLGWGWGSLVRIEFSLPPFSLLSLSPFSRLKRRLKHVKKPFT